jgi:nucleoid-associated protein YgaU
MDRLKIIQLSNPSKFVLFDHNPEQLQVTGRGSRRNNRQSAPKGQPAQSSPAGNGADPLKLMIKKARLTGPETKQMCDTLLDWVKPQFDLLGAVLSLAGLSIGNRPLPLLVQWGPPKVGFTFTALLIQVDVTYVRITEEGIPVHAVVNLTLNEEPTIPMLTNPTSGGRPGRDQHTMVLDESLMSVAQQKFGHPGAWRAIAEVNGIDDPADVRPGQVIYLPAREELKRLAESAR